MTSILRDHEDRIKALENGAAIAEAIREARAAALEEAAKVADQSADLGRDYAVGDWEECQRATASDIATAIRALKDKTSD